MARDDTTDESVTDETPVDLWIRPDQSGSARMADPDAGVVPFDDLHFHRYCDLVPIRLREGDGAEGVLARLRALPARIDLFPTPDGVEGTDESVSYLPSRADAAKWWHPTGLVRTALQYTPLFVGCIALLFVIGAELVDHVEGLSAYLPPLSPSLSLSVLPVVVVAVVVWGVMASLVVEAGFVGVRELLQAVAVYGLGGLLAVGTGLSILTVVLTETPQKLPANIVFTSGYLLLILVGGLLTYDAMLRTEHLFGHLDEKLIVERENGGAYDAFREKMNEQLAHETPLFAGRSVRTYLLFAPLLVFQFAAVWAFAGSGPQNLDFRLTFWVNVGLDTVLAIIYFQLFVLIEAFHNLVTGGVTLYREDTEDEDDDPEYHHEQNEAGTLVPEQVDLLSYRPFHPDGRGGFRDFGKFATRVNVLLILGGLYVVYRLYVQGARALPVDTLSLDALLTLDGLVWAVSYVGPILVLFAVAFAWLYYSFWTLHVKMARERERHYTESAHRRRADENDDIPRDAPLGEVRDAADWQESRAAAPVWPVDARLLASLVSSSVAPLLLALPKFLVL